MTPEFRQEIYSLTEEDLIAKKIDPSPQGSQNTESGSTVSESNQTESQQDLEAIEFLMSMGFELDHVHKAIRKFAVDPDNSRRIDWLLSGAVFDEVDDKPPQV